MNQPCSAELWAMFYAAVGTRTGTPKEKAEAADLMLQEFHARWVWYDAGRYTGWRRKPPPREEPR